MAFGDVLNFTAIVNMRHPDYLRNSIDWSEWRDCFEGGRWFRDRYLEPMPERETGKQFLRRKNLTPNSTYAKREINKIKNALFQRFDDILRRDGTKATMQAIDGDKKGVDQKGKSMNAFIGKVLLTDLLVMGQVGVLVDAPKIPGPLASDVPANFRPFLSPYSVENIPLLVPGDPDDESDWKAVTLRTRHATVTPFQGTFTETDTFRHYWINEAGFVDIAFLDNTGKLVKDIEHTELTQIPFVMYDIYDSLMKEVCRHQIALLNIVSSDTTYQIDCNFPFLHRQRSGIVADHITGTDDSADIGLQQGLWYGQGLNPPGYATPPTDNMRLSIDMRQVLKREIHELIFGTLEGLGEEGTIDSGLAFVGQCLEHGESRTWDHWSAFETKNPARRRVPTVKYPDNWTLKSESDRIEDASKLLDMINRLPFDREGKKELAKLMLSKMLRGKVSTEKLDKLSANIDAAPFTTSDPAIVLPALKEGAMSIETAVLALGGTVEEAQQAKKDKAERAAFIAKAQADAAAGAGRGNPELSVDESSSRAEQDDDRDGDLGADDEEGQRGEGAPIPNLED